MSVLLDLGKYNAHAHSLEQKSVQFSGTFPRASLHFRCTSVPVLLRTQIKKKHLNNAVNYRFPHKVSTMTIYSYKLHTVQFYPRGR